MVLVISGVNEDWANLLPPAGPTALQTRSGRRHGRKSKRRMFFLATKAGVAVLGYTNLATILDIAPLLRYIGLFLSMGIFDILCIFRPFFAQNRGV